MRGKHFPANGVDNELLGSSEGALCSPGKARGRQLDVGASQPVVCLSIAVEKCNCIYLFEK